MGGPPAIATPQVITGGAQSTSPEELTHEFTDSPVQWTAARSPSGEGSGSRLCIVVEEPRRFGKLGRRLLWAALLFSIFMNFFASRQPARAIFSR